MRQAGPEQAGCGELGPLPGQRQALVLQDPAGETLEEVDKTLAAGLRGQLGWHMATRVIGQL